MGSGPDLRWTKKPGLQSPFQLIPKVFDGGLKTRALYGPERDLAQTLKNSPMDFKSHWFYVVFHYVAGAVSKCFHLLIIPFTVDQQE